MEHTKKKDIQILIYSIFSFCLITDFIYLFPPPPLPNFSQFSGTESVISAWIRQSGGATEATAWSSFSSKFVTFLQASSQISPNSQ